ncbi:MAG: phosphatidylinositol mannoside acyltransferase [Actinomycetota bacterium]
MDDERPDLMSRLGTLQYTSMERIAMRWPPFIATRLFRLYGALTWQLIPRLRGVVAGNLAHVLGQPPDSELVMAAAREAFSLYARYWYDSFRVRVMSKQEVNERFVMDDIANLDQALEAGRGAIVALPHLGNWDVAGHFMAVNGYRLCAVAEKLPNKRVFDLFLRHREELGMKIVPLDNTARVGPQLVQLLADNWVLALVADRDLTGRGVEVDMFGAPRRLPAGPALLSLTSGAPLMACPVYTTRAGWHSKIGRPLEVERSGDMRTDVGALTAALAAEFERAIAAKPTDWHMFQPAWEDDGLAAGRGLSPATASA